MLTLHGGFSIPHYWRGMGNSLLSGQGGRPVLCRMCNNIPDLCPLDARGTSQSWQPKMSAMSLGGWFDPRGENLDLSFSRDIWSSRTGKMSRWALAEPFSAYLIYISWFHMGFHMLPIPMLEGSIETHWSRSSGSGTPLEIRKTAKNTQDLFPILYFLLFHMHF